jgi:tRNA U34 5-methylaminomethyl-2-thiouridine-forming methyltransferase MnmC
MHPEIIITKDGSHSLYRADLNEQYHSVFGAVQESMHIFIQNGFNKVSKTKIQIFEMGFGTGLNALLTWIKSSEKGISVDYLSIEKYPVSADILAKLNYSSIPSPDCPEIFKLICDSKWNEKSVIGDFILQKICGDILDYAIPSGNDLVYYDAFSPDKEPLLWTDKVFGSIYDSMNEGGIFMTYCSKGNVRRMLQGVGFKVEKLAGPPGKLHILRAVK